MSNKVSSFMKRFKCAKALRGQWEPQLKETYDLFLPNRQGFNSEAKGQDKSEQLYTDVGVQSLTKFANNIKTKLMPSQQRWAKLAPRGNFQVDLIRGNITEEDVVDVQEALDMDTEVMFHYIWGSNFDSAVTEALQDMAISTGAFMIQDTGDLDSPLNFVAIPADQLSIEEASDGVIKSAWREWTIKAREIDHMWPDRKQDTKLNRLIADKPECDIKVVEGTVYNISNNDYEYSVHIAQSDCKLVYETEYEVSPWVIFRWGKTPQETWGRGVAMNSKHTMAMLNQLEKDVATARGQAINPAAIIDTNGIVNPHKISFSAGSRILKSPTWNGETSQSKAIEFLSTGSNFNVSTQAKGDYEQEIKDAFYLMQLPSVTGGTKTATEYDIRANEALEQQNAAFTRLQKELIEQTVSRIYYILGRYGIVTPLEMKGKVVSVQPTSPLAMYQNNKDLQGVTSYIATMVQTFGEEQGFNIVRQEIDLESIGGYVADKMSLPTSVRLTGEKRKQVENAIKAEQVAQAQQQQAMAMQQQEVEAQQQQIPPEKV